MITTDTPATWQDLQNEVARILRECNFTVEVEKRLVTVRGSVEVDVYAEEVVKGRQYLVLCECKYWKARVSQSTIHGFRTVVSDVGANIGYVISRTGFQAGAYEASELTNLKLVTWEEFQDLFEESWYDTFFSPTLAERLDPLLTYVEPILPRWFDALPDEEQSAYLELKRKYDVFGWMMMTFTPYLRMIRKDVSRPELPLINVVRHEPRICENVPAEILEAAGFRQFFDLVVSYGEAAISQFRAIRDRNGHA